MRSLSDVEPYRAGYVRRLDARTPVLVGRCIEKTVRSRVPDGHVAAHQTRISYRAAS
jgi:hypothetical protein